MKRSLLLLIKIALAVAAGGGPLSYAAPPAGVAISHPREPVVIVSYRGAVARAAASVVTVYAAHTSEGIGFAIPVDLVQTVAASLKAQGRVARAWLGLSARVTPGGEGARVVTVDRGGPADRAGIAPGIVQVGEKRVRHPQDVTNIAISTDPGTHVPIDIMRNGKRTALDVQLAPLPQQARPCARSASR